MNRTPTPGAERMRRYRRRERSKRLLVPVVLEPAEITALMRRGYLLAGDRENIAEIEAAVNSFIAEALVTP